MEGQAENMPFIGPSITDMQWLHEIGQRDRVNGSEEAYYFYTFFFILFNLLYVYGFLACVPYLCSALGDLERVPDPLELGAEPSLLTRARSTLFTAEPSL